MNKVKFLIIVLTCLLASCLPNKKFSAWPDHIDIYQALIPNSDASLIRVPVEGHTYLLVKDQSVEFISLKRQEPTLDPKVLIDHRQEIFNEHVPYVFRHDIKYLYWIHYPETLIGNETYEMKGTLHLLPNGDIRYITFVEKDKHEHHHYKGEDFIDVLLYKSEANNLEKLFEKACKDSICSHEMPETPGRMEVTFDPKN